MKYNKAKQKGGEGVVKAGGGGVVQRGRRETDRMIQVPVGDKKAEETQVPVCDEKEEREGCMKDTGKNKKVTDQGVEEKIQVTGGGGGRSDQDGDGAESVRRRGARAEDDNEWIPPKEAVKNSVPS